MEPNLQDSSAPRTAILDRATVVAACAVSAGTHAALVPSHMEHEPKLGLAFVVATGLLLAVGAAVALFAATARAAQAGALLFAGLLATKTVESAGLAFALKLNRAVSGHGPSTLVRR